MSDPDSRAAPDSTITPQRIAAWNEYWATGALHSCTGSFEGNYPGAIRRFWEDLFATLPAAPRVLDLCCGNAPLSKLLVDVGGPGVGGRIDALDAARIDPPWLPSLSDPVRGAIHIHAGEDAARLPFEAESFDLCMSQYGVEYAGPAAMREARRVLRPGAMFAAVVHHHDALPVRIAREELRHQAWLVQAQGLLDCTATMIEPMARSATAAGQAALCNDAAARDSRARFNAVLQELEKRAAASQWPDMLGESRDAAMAALELARTRGEDAGRRHYLQLRSELDAMRFRQLELVECALDVSGVRDFIAPIGDAQPCIDVLSFENGGIAGWAVIAVRG